MKFMLMCYHDTTAWDALGEAEQAKIMDEYGEWTQAIVRSGHFRGSTKLAPTSASTTVREKNGRRVVTDGPFAETREQLGGVHLIECKDLDEALAIAGRVPTLRSGGTIEVRPVESSS
jgi:hypothetical protein